MEFLLISNPKAAARTNFASITLNDIDNDDNDDQLFGSAGTISAPSSSRARMLAQQRELQLKKRQVLELFLKKYCIQVILFNFEITIYFLNY